MPNVAAWPIAPRPFVEEAMGSWLGRLAARYRMDVWEFAQHNDLELPAAYTNVGWLLMPPLAPTTVKRLALLARIPAELIESIQTPAEWISNRKQVLFCINCLFLNRIDVTAPRWIREWLRPDAQPCVTHPAHVRDATPAFLARCKNFAGVLKHISRSEERRQIEGIYWHSQQQRFLASRHPSNLR